MLTVDFERLGLRPGERILDLGCGGGRHAFEAARRGAAVVAVDRAGSETKAVTAMLGAMRLAGEIPATLPASAVTADVLRLPFADGAFRAVIAAEVLEHVPADRAALGELVRVLRPGGALAVTVPRWWPEKVCWALSDGYHAPAVPDGHVRIYRGAALRRLLTEAGLALAGAHHAHALHSPFWWLKCAVGLERDDHPAVRCYHRFLVWDITRRHRWVRAVERLLDPVLGKSLVVYATKPMWP